MCTEHRADSGKEGHLNDTNGRWKKENWKQTHRVWLALCLVNQTISFVNLQTACLATILVKLNWTTSAQYKIYNRINRAFWNWSLKKIIIVFSLKDFIFISITYILRAQTGQLIKQQDTAQRKVKSWLMRASSGPANTFVLTPLSVYLHFNLPKTNVGYTIFYQVIKHKSPFL